jgi:hypothetical protein
MNSSEIAGQIHQPVASISPVKAEIPTMVSTNAVHARNAMPHKLNPKTDPKACNSATCLDDQNQGEETLLHVPH